MEYRQLGQSEVKVSSIAFGAWAIGGWMWGGADEEDALNAIECAIDLGMTTIDTAPVYGFGKSEILVGKVIKSKRDKVQLLTKYGLRWDTDQGVFHFNSEDENGNKVSIYKFAGPESIIAECEKSLKRLQTDRIDLYQIHWPDSSSPIEDTMEAVARLKKEGKILSAGVCNYSKEQMMAANEVIDIVTNQVPYSMVLRDIEDELIPYCLDSRKSILAYSPLQRGLLTGKIRGDYTFKKGDHRPSTTFFKEPNLSRTNHFLDRILPIAKDNGLTLSQLVIYWTIHQPAVSSALVGARNRKQVEENIKAGDVTLEKSAINEINRELKKLKMER